MPTHADFAWANLTGPQCWILDWEDWGLAPRRLDCRDGQLMRLFFATGIVGAPAGYSGPLLAPARAQAQRLLTALRS